MMSGKCLLLLMLAFLSGSARGQQPADEKQPNSQPSNAESRKVCVAGDVVRPSEVLFKRGLTVTQAIEAAGGLIGPRKGKEVRVFSKMADAGELRVIHLDLGIVEKRHYWDLELQSFDIVEVYSPKKKSVSPRPSTNPCPSMIPESIFRAPRL